MTLVRRIEAAMLVALTGALPASPVMSFEQLEEECFIANAVCPALSSIRKNTNPGGIQTEVAHEYELLGANKAAATHLQIRIQDAEPQGRWVAVGCGQAVAACEGGPIDGDDDGAIGAGEPSFSDNLLAVSWQPTFCELKEASKPECVDQEGRFDADHFALHGLWPQPNGHFYCGVEKPGRNTDWCDLPALDLAEGTRDELDQVMPGTQSCLHRHEWTKHGTCYSHAPEEYYAETLRLMAELNASPVRALFAARIGEEVTADEIGAAFNEAFGQGADRRVEIHCSEERGVRMIGELWIALKGEINEGTTLAELVHAADESDDRGCARGLVDPAGFQL